MDWLSAGASIIGGLSGIFSKEDNSPPPVKFNFGKLRRAATKAGFNPLTALGATGGRASSVGSASSGPPLASFDMLAGGLQGASDIMTGRTALQQQREKVALDLATIELDQLRATTAARVAGVASIGASPRSTPATRTLAAGPRVNFTAPSLQPLPSGAATSMVSPLYDTTTASPMLNSSRIGMSVPNPEMPMPPEELATGWALDGTFVPNVDEVLARNFGRDPFAIPKRAAQVIGGVLPSISLPAMGGVPTRRGPMGTVWTSDGWQRP